MVILYFSPFDQCLVSQCSDKIGKFDIIITALYTHIAVYARPDFLAYRALTILAHQYFLHYEARIKLLVIFGDGANHRALATIQAETNLGLVDNS